MEAQSCREMALAVARARMRRDSNGGTGVSVVLRLRLGGALTALVVALVTANGGSEQMAGTTAAAEAGRGNEKVCKLNTPSPPLIGERGSRRVFILIISLVQRIWLGLHLLHFKNFSFNITNI